MKKTLCELEALLRELNCPILKYLQEGKENSESEVVRLFSNLKLPIRKDIVEMYSWKNGVKGLYEVPIGQLELFPNGIMLPFEYAVSSYVLEAKTHKLFKKEYFPLFTSGGGDYILVNMDERKAFYGQLFLFSPSILLTNNPIAIYDSIATLFDTLLETYRLSGYYFKSDSSVLEVDYGIENEVALRMNPKSEFWKQN